MGYVDKHHGICMAVQCIRCVCVHFRQINRCEVDKNNIQVGRVIEYGNK